MGFVIPRAITRAYSLDGAAVVRQLESYGNENWLIEDGHGRRYILRRHLLNADLRRIEFQLALQQHLAEHGLPTATCVVTNSGLQYATDGDGVPWVIITYIEGSEYDFSRPGQAVEAGRTLARFHLITEPFRSDAPGPEYKAPVRECWANASRDLQTLAELFDGEGVEGELSYLSGWWQAVLAAWPLGRFDKLPAGWLHGDFHGRNMVFAGDRVAGLFDFDDVDRGPYVYDVGAGMFRFGREARSSLSIRPEFARAFIEGYETLRPLSDEERAALATMVAMGYPPNPQNYRYWRDYGEDSAHRFRRDVATIRTLRTEMERIAHELGLMGSG
jgi:homoserine kinase type II